MASRTNGERWRATIKAARTLLEIKHEIEAEDGGGSA